MNAPLAGRGAIRPAPIDTANEDGSVEGVARHVSTDGCQFLLVSGLPPEPGRQMTFDLGPQPVSGTIRWVVEERIGFAFDRPITLDLVAELSAHFATLKALRLIPNSLPTLPG